MLQLSLKAPPPAFLTAVGPTGADGDGKPQKAGLHKIMTQAEWATAVTEQYEPELKDGHDPRQGGFYVDIRPDGMTVHIDHKTFRWIQQVK